MGSLDGIGKHRTATGTLPSHVSSRHWFTSLTERLSQSISNRAGEHQLVINWGWPAGCLSCAVRPQGPYCSKDHTASEIVMTLCQVPCMPGYCVGVEGWPTDVRPERMAQLFGTPQLPRIGATVASATTCPVTAWAADSQGQSSCDRVHLSVFLPERSPTQAEIAQACMQFLFRACLF